MECASSTPLTGSSQGMGCHKERAKYSGQRVSADELACKPESVIWAFVCVGCIGGVAIAQVRALVMLANGGVR